MNILAPLAVGLLLWIQGDPPSLLLARLKALDDSSAVRVVAADPSGTRGLLDALLARVDASVHSERERPEQRRVQYDAESLALGLRIGSLFADATGDRTYARRFAARKQRLDGTVLLNERRYREALTPLTAALREAESLGDKWLHAITRINLAYGHLELGRGREALAESEGAVEIARTLDDRARGLALYNLASVHMHLKNYARSIEYSRQAIAASRAAGIKLWEGNSLLNMGAAHQQLGAVAASQDAFEQALRVLETTRDRIGTGRALYNLGMLAMGQERYDAAGAYLERALPIIREADIRHSHEIELDPKRYQNPIEIAALQALIEVYSHAGDDKRRAAHMEALRRVRARPIHAEHTHKHPH
jgi:tetratricopeptide (TPR) repeat protein